MTIRFKATLSRPADPPKATWTFLVLPATASTRLPSRGPVAVEGTLDGHAFLATLSPDGEGGHWLKVDRRLRERAGVAAGDRVTLAVSPTDRVPEPPVPAALRDALASNPRARGVWDDITPAARRDWIDWIASAKKLQTRSARVAKACDMLASGKRRACCFDRSGMYSGALSAPKAAD